MTKAAEMTDYGVVSVLNEDAALLRAHCDKLPTAGKFGPAARSTLNGAAALLEHEANKLTGDTDRKAHQPASAADVASARPHTGE